MSGIRFGKIYSFEWNKNVPIAADVQAQAFARQLKRQGINAEVGVGVRDNFVYTNEKSSESDPKGIALNLYRYWLLTDPRWWTKNFERLKRYNLDQQFKRSDLSELKPLEHNAIAMKATMSAKNKMSFTQDTLHKPNPFPPSLDDQIKELLRLQP